MTTTLKRGENGPVLELDPQILSDIGIDLQTPLDVTVEGNDLRISPRVPAGDFDREQAFRTAMDKVNRRYGRMLKRLAE